MTSDHHIAYRFDSNVPMSEVGDTLTLALLALESLHGDDAVRLETTVAVDERRRTVAIDAALPLGQELNRVFAGYVRRAFGSCSFQARRVSGRRSRTAA